MQQEFSSDLVFYVNGQKITDNNVDPETTLLHYLRTNLGLTGTKLGCGEGGCGACTVMVSRYERTRKKIHHYSVVSCLVPACSLHGFAVTTVEGIGSVKNGLHPVQERLAKCHGTQCGFCSPGMVMSMYALLRSKSNKTDDVSMEEIDRALQGNLCRCTGYRGIIDGFKTFSKEFCELGEACCRYTPKKKDPDTAQGTELVDRQNFKHLDSSQDLIFPPELQNSYKYDGQCLKFQGENVTWYRPSCLKDLLELKQRYPEAAIVSGCTAIGAAVKARKVSVLISATQIQELQEISREDKGLRFGAAVTLSGMAEELKKAIQTMPEHQTRAFMALVEMMKRFAGNQIRNVATIGGSIMSASSTSDLVPLFLAYGVVVEFLSNEEVKSKVNMLSDTFYSHKEKTLLSPNEILMSVFIPFTEKNEFCSGYKQSVRREAATSIINAGMRVVLDVDSHAVKELCLVYGGMGPVIVMASEARINMVGKIWEDSILPDIYRSLCEDLPLHPGDVGDTEQYRQTVAQSLFFKFFLSVRLQLPNMINENRTHASATVSFPTKPHTSTQTFQEVAPGQLSDDPVGRPMVHVSALQHTTGETQYIDDMPQIKNELIMAYVYSTKAHANIKLVDPEDALAMPGVKAFVTHTDVPGSNLWGVRSPDEELYASTKVLCQGQAIGAILAKSKEQAQRAARKVKVVYDELEPILTIQDAIKAGSFLEPPKVLKKGDTEEAFKQADHVIVGECHTGGQIHFYLETQSVLAIPQRENDEIEMFVSTQSPTTVQMAVASALGISSNRIAVRVKRLGGGFGGKEIRPSLYAACTAVAAQKLGRPVRSVLDREEDMVMTGTRQPALGKYKVGFTKEGKILALEVDLYFNAGMSLDVSVSIRDQAMLYLDGAYKIANVLFRGHLCKTNIPSNTAFRGFGIPQAYIISETWINDIATTLNVPASQVREMNFKKEGDVTFFGYELTSCYLQKCWDNCLGQSDYHRRNSAVQDFNRQNRWRKRGITMTPIMYALDFLPPFLNQGGALVHVYTDGSVLLTHGGVEMGQGLHTKMIQVASRSLGIPSSKILISETGTNTVPNTSPTAASSGSDINGMAVLYACEKIMKRLEPIRKASPDGTWEDWVIAAYFQRISLSSTGFYKIPGVTIDGDMDIHPAYFSYGAACSEVEIDCLTGEHQVLRTDIVMDVGQSLNPAIDIGQIEGAFLQGYGMVMLEQIKRSPSGYLLSRGPGTYKIPIAGDIPGEFNVTLLKGSGNVKAVYSSKGIGEPPLLSAISVFCAVKEAIMSARADAGHHEIFRLDSPATPERVRMACEDHFTKMCRQPNTGS